MKLVLALAVISALFQTQAAQAGGDIAHCKGAHEEYFVETASRLEGALKRGEGEISFLIDREKWTFADAKIKILSYELLKSDDADESDVLKTYSVTVALDRPSSNRRVTKGLDHQVYTCELQWWHK
jgi:hypothetical protein